jgi:hypothetical protein
LKGKVLARLAAEGGGVPWKWLAGAAIVLILTAAGAAWYLQPLPTVSMQELIEMMHVGQRELDESQVEKYFADRGLRVKVPRDFHYKYLQEFEIVEFRQKRVAKLVFVYPDVGQERMVRAEVLILPHSQFNVHQLQPGTLNHRRSLTIIQPPDSFTYLIFHDGSLKPLRRDMN